MDFRHLKANDGQFWDARAALVVALAAAGGSPALTLVSLVPQCMAGVLISAVSTAKLTKAVSKVEGLGGWMMLGG